MTILFSILWLVRAEKEERARWARRMGDLLHGLRHHAGAHLKRVRHRQVHTSRGLASLVTSLATMDFALCAARHAMEAIPGLSSDEKLIRVCTAAERAIFYSWSRLGFYRKATAWARKGLATVVGTTLTPSRSGSRGDSDPGILIDDISHSKLAYRATDINSWRKKKTER